MLEPQDDLREDLAAAIRHSLSGRIRTELITNRRGSRVWRLMLVNGITVALKAAYGTAVAPRLPAQEAAVIRAAGSAAGRVLASGDLADGGAWMVMPWYWGHNLHDDFADVRHNAVSPIARYRALRAAAFAAHALAGLHDYGWAHGDVQPEHIIRLDTIDRSQLLDLAWAHKPGHPLTQQLTTPYPGMLVHLEAPEIAHQLLDQCPVTPTPAADVYALAGSLWACWTESWPVDYEAAGINPAPGDLTAKRMAVASGQFHRHIGSIGWTDFGALMRSGLSFEPDDRPTARDLGRALDTLAFEEREKIP